MTMHKIQLKNLNASVMLASSHEAHGSQKSISLDYDNGRLTFKVYTGYKPRVYSSAAEAVAAYNAYDETAPYRAEPEPIPCYVADNGHGTG